MNNKFLVGPDDTRQLPADDYGRMPIVEAETHLEDRYRDVVQFGETYNVSLSRAAEHLFAPDADSDTDISVDVLERNGVKLASDWQGPATGTEEVFDTPALAAFAKEYVENCYFYQVHDAALFRVGKPMAPGVGGPQMSPVAQFMRNVGGMMDNVAQFATNQGNTRGALPSAGNAFNPPTVGMVMPDKVLYQDMEIADIVGEVREITGSKYTAPKVTEPKDYKLTGIGEFGTIPKWRVQLGEDLAETSKAGYANEISYEFLRSGGETMEGLAQFAMWMAFLTTAEIVNEGITLATSTGAKTYSAGGATLDRKGAIKLLAQRTKGTQFNVIIGNLDFFVEYAATDITFNSNNNAPLTVESGGSRVFLNTPMGMQQITYRTAAEVSNLSGTDPKAGLWDKRFTLRYIFERNSNIEEQTTDASIQAICFYRTFSYVWQLMQMNADARMVATLA